MMFSLIYPLLIHDFIFRWTYFLYIIKSFNTNRLQTNFGNIKKYNDAIINLNI